MNGTLWQTLLLDSNNEELLKLALMPIGHIIKYLCRILKTAVCFLGDIWQYKPTNFSFGDFFSFLDG